MGAGLVVPMGTLPQGTWCWAGEYASTSGPSGGATVEIDARGCMTKIHEKPSDEILKKLGEPIYCSMNCWRFTSKLFDACRAIPLSPRGEYEITDAAQYCIDVLKEPFVAQKHRLPVLDLSSRGDISSVAERLTGITVRY